jgi:hypothetical protein
MGVCVQVHVKEVKMSVAHDSCTAKNERPSPSLTTFTTYPCGFICGLLGGREATVASRASELRVKVNTLAEGYCKYLCPW